jgi:hypothetical protein
MFIKKPKILKMLQVIDVEEKVTHSTHRKEIRGFS